MGNPNFRSSRFEGCSSGLEGRSWNKFVYPIRFIHFGNEQKQIIMKRKKHLAPILCASLLGLLTLNPLSNPKDKALNLRFDTILGSTVSQATSDDPREGGLLRYKFFVKEKETIDNPIRELSNVFDNYDRLRKEAASDYLPFGVVSQEPCSDKYYCN